MLCFSRRVVHSGKLPEIYVRKKKTLKANFLSGAKTAPELREIGAGPLRLRAAQELGLQ
jgi:hypothetical protein